MDNTILMGDADHGGGCACTRARGILEISMPSCQFCREPKTALKKKVLQNMAVRTKSSVKSSTHVRRAHCAPYWSGPLCHGVSLAAALQNQASFDGLKRSRLIFGNSDLGVMDLSLSSALFQKWKLSLQLSANPILQILSRRKQDPVFVGG